MSNLPAEYVTNSYLHEMPYDRFDSGGIHLMRGDVADFYEEWPSPTVIISDGPYGIGGFPGDSYSPQQLGQWYEPHIAQWAKHSSPITTLWLWNTEVGWATVHPFLIRHGWEYVSCCIWDKGMGHIAGNVNTKTIRRLPVVTEICAQYVKKAMFLVNGREASMKEWLRAEWARTELPFSKTNEVCGVIDAATRKRLGFGGCLATCFATCPRQNRHKVPLVVYAARRCF